MRIRIIATTFIALAGMAFGLQSALAIEGYPAAKCSFNADKSSIALSVSNSGAGNYACSASCQYTIAGERALQTLGCNYNLSANTAEKTACDVDGKGPNYFADIRPTRFVCQPR
jgi:hypothetical protein